MSEKTGDIVYTPAWVVTDMLEAFRPVGKILDPCRCLYTELYSPG